MAVPPRVPALRPRRASAAGTGGDRSRAGTRALTRQTPPFDLRQRRPHALLRLEGDRRLRRLPRAPPGAAPRASSARSPSRPRPRGLRRRGLRAVAARAQRRKFGVDRRSPAAVASRPVRRRMGGHYMRFGLRFGLLAAIALVLGCCPRVLAIDFTIAGKLVIKPGKLTRLSRQARSPSRQRGTPVIRCSTVEVSARGRRRGTVRIQLPRSGRQWKGSRPGGRERRRVHGSSSRP